MAKGLELVPPPTKRPRSWHAPARRLMVCLAAGVLLWASVEAELRGYDWASAIGFLVALGCVWQAGEDGRW